MSDAQQSVSRQQFIQRWDRLTDCSPSRPNVPSPSPYVLSRYPVYLMVGA